MNSQKALQNSEAKFRPSDYMDNRPMIASLFKDKYEAQNEVGQLREEVRELRQENHELELANQKITLQYSSSKERTRDRAMAMVPLTIISIISIGLGTGFVANDKGFGWWLILVGALLELTMLLIIKPFGKE